MDNRTKTASEGLTDWWISSEVQDIRIGEFDISAYRYINETAEKAWLIAICSSAGVRTYWHRSEEFFDVETIMDDCTTRAISLWRFEAHPCNPPIRDSEADAIRLAVSNWEKAEASGRWLSKCADENAEICISGAVPMFQVFKEIQTEHLREQSN